MNNNNNIPAIRHTREGLRRTRTHERCNARVRHAPLPRWHARSGRAQLLSLRVSVRAAPGHEHVDFEEGRGPRGLGKARAGHAQPAPVERRRLLIDLCANTPQHPSSQIGRSQFRRSRPRGRGRERASTAALQSGRARCKSAMCRPTIVLEELLDRSHGDKVGSRCRSVSAVAHASVSDQVRSSERP